MQYELATLTFNLQDTLTVTRSADAYVNGPSAGGRLLGAWTTDIGALGRMTILREFDSPEALTAERERTLFHPNPFGPEVLSADQRNVISTIETDSYKAFPFLPPVAPGRFGSLYEIRTYRLKPGTLAQTLAAWEAALPARTELSPLVLNMYATDGAPRITHFWPYADANERFEVRAKAVTAGIWPPKGGAANLLEGTSMLCVPTPFSPLA